jgi:hypothetical protein
MPGHSQRNRRSGSRWTAGRPGSFVVTERWVWGLLDGLFGDLRSDVAERGAANVAGLRFTESVG